MNDDVIYAIIRKLFAVAALAYRVSLSLFASRTESNQWNCVVGSNGGGVIAENEWHISHMHTISIQQNEFTFYKIGFGCSKCCSAGKAAVRCVLVCLFACKMLYYNKAAIKPHLM